MQPHMPLCRRQRHTSTAASGCRGGTCDLPFFIPVGPSSPTLITAARTQTTPPHLLMTFSSLTSDFLYMTVPTPRTRLDEPPPITFPYGLPAPHAAYHIPISGSIVRQIWYTQQIMWPAVAPALHTSIQYHLVGTYHSLATFVSLSTLLNRRGTACKRGTVTRTYILDYISGHHTNALTPAPSLWPVSGLARRRSFLAKFCLICCTTCRAHHADSPSIASRPANSARLHWIKRTQTLRVPHPFYLTRY